MARLNIFILLTKVGPDREAQQRAIQSAIEVNLTHDQIYVDDVSVRRSKKDHAFPMRTAAIGHCRAGDTFVVASPGLIGIGREDIRKVLHQLYEKRVPLFDSSTGKTILWTDEMADGLWFLERAEKEYKSLVTARARAGRIGAPKKAMKITEIEAEAMWRDTARYPSPQKVAEATGLTQRTLYNKYGKRHPVPPVPVKKSRPIVAPAGYNFVYVMSRSDGCHKIGFSQNLTQRLAVLSDLMKMPLSLRHYIERPGDAFEVEQLAHKWIGLHRRDGEWFEVSEDQAIGAIQRSCEFMDTAKGHRRERALVETEEDRLGRSMTRPEITAYMKRLKQKDETDA